MPVRVHSYGSDFVFTKTMMSQRKNNPQMTVNCSGRVLLVFVDRHQLLHVRRGGVTTSPRIHVIDRGTNK